MRAAITTITVLIVVTLGVAALGAPVPPGISSAAGPDFTLSGSPAGSLNLGGPALPISIKVTNLHGGSLRITELTTTVQSDKSSCSVARNLRLVQANISLAKPLSVPGHGSVSLPAQGIAAPTVRFLNLPTNQNGCAGATFSLSYTAVAQ